MINSILDFRDYGAPYDSTIGVPSGFFIACWIVLILFGLRVAWEYRDRIFISKRNVPKDISSRKRRTKKSP